MAACVRCYELNPRRRLNLPPFSHAPIIISKVITMPLDSKNSVAMILNFVLRMGLAKLCHRLMARFAGLLYKDCKEFDSSLSRGPFSFTLGGGQVIQGWDSGKSFCQLCDARGPYIPDSPEFAILPMIRLWLYSGTRI